MSAPHRYSDEPSVTIDPAKVPPEFLHLIPLAKEWSIGDDAELDAYIAAQLPENLAKVASAFGPYFAGLQKWSESVSGTVPQPDEVVLFDTATAAVATVFTKLR
jgi:hypothetical protein